MPVAHGVLININEPEMPKRYPRCLHYIPWYIIIVKDEL